MKLLFALILKSVRVWHFYGFEIELTTVEDLYNAALYNHNFSDISNGFCS